MMQLSYKIDGFEGPLDLLLTLISKNKFDINNIPISNLLQQYLEQIEIMKEQDLNIASEFLEMASRLVYIKSLALLPKHQEEQEELEQELVGQLLEYQICKEIAQKLSEKVDLNKLVRETEKIPIDTRYKLEHPKDILVKYYLLAVGKGKRFLPPSEEKFSGIVSNRIISVASQIVFVLRTLWNKGETSYKKLFESKFDKSEKVAVFLAVLELVKGKRIRIKDDESDSTVVLMGRCDK